MNDREDRQGDDKSKKDSPSAVDPALEKLYELVTSPLEGKGEPRAVKSTPAESIDKIDRDGNGRKEERQRFVKKFAECPEACQVKNSPVPNVNDNTANCHGTTFGGGEVFIDNFEVSKIIPDNYTEVEKGKTDVCNVVVWGDEKGTNASHSALVVEVDGQGNPTMVIGKTSQLGELWAHPPECYNRPKKGEKDEDNRPVFRTYKRNGWPKSVTETERKDLETKHTEAKAAWERNKADKNLRKAMDLAGYALCRRKNQLDKKSQPSVGGPEKKG